MAKHYVTFGQDHKHEINNTIFDKNCVAVFEAKNPNDGREKAFKYFDVKFCFEYHDKEFDHSSMVFFPNGFVELIETNDIEVVDVETIKP